MVGDKVKFGQGESYYTKKHIGQFHCFCTDAVFSTDIGPLLGGRINDQLDKEVHPALDKVLNMAGGISAHFSFPLSVCFSVTIPSSYCHLNSGYSCRMIIFPPY